MMCAFYGVFCCAFSYVTYCLGAAGYSDKRIGFIVAAACLAASIMQPVAGRLADHYPAFIWKKQVIFYALVEFSAAVLAILLKETALVGFLYGAMLFLALVMMPMVNSAGFYYSSRGIEVTFGIARGCGSMSCAAVSFVLGLITVKFGPVMVPIVNALLVLLVFVIALSMPVYAAEEKAEKVAEKAVSGGDNRSFITKYPVFILMVAGMLLFLFFHNMVQTYFIRMLENVGGNSKDLGIAVAIAAAIELPMLFYFDKLQKKIAAKWLLVVAGAAFTLKGVLFMICTNVIGIYAVQLLQVFSFALFAGAGVYYSNSMMAEEDKVTGQALVSMTEALSSVAGSFVGGILMDSGGIMTLLQFATSAAVMGTLVSAAAAKFSKTRNA